MRPSVLLVITLCLSLLQDAECGNGNRLGAGLAWVSSDTRSVMTIGWFVRGELGPTASDNPLDYEYRPTLFLLRGCCDLRAR
jgi:hypothetical protein